MLNSFLGNLGDMNHAFFSGSELDECTEFLNAYDLALENLAFFKVCGNNLNHLNSLIHHNLVGTAYGYLTVIGNINLYAGTSNNLVDGLASLAYYIANLFRVNLDGNNLGCVLADFCSGSGNGFLHTVVHDEESCFTASCDSAFYDRSCQTVNLNIHLDSGNTFGSTGYLKVHIAEEVFQTLDIGKKYEILVGFTGNQTTGNTCYHLLDGNTGSH